MNPTNDNLGKDKLSKVKASTPFLAIDLDNIDTKYNELTKALNNFSVYYAVKCNPEKPILQRLKTLGSKYEIASSGELDRLIEIGIEPKDVIFSNPVKSREQIEYTFNKGVYRFVFDSPEELKKLSEVAPGSSVYLRLSVSNHGSLISLSNKFGANKSHAVDLLSLAKDLGLKPYGLSFHVGSQSENIHLWDEAFDDSVDVIEELNDIGIKLQMLNIGGGFPIKYNEKVPKIKDIAKKIHKNVKKLPYELELFCEPGRYLVGEAGVIAGKIIGKATRQNRPWIYLDVGRFQSFIEMFESDSLSYPIFTSLDNVSKNEPKSMYTITGPSCDSYDTIERDVSLPTRLKEGDFLYFASAGAYTHVYGSAFNDFPVPEVVYLKG